MRSGNELRQYQRILLPSLGYLTCICVYLQNILVIVMYITNFHLGETGMLYFIVNIGTMRYFCKARAYR